MEGAPRKTLESAKQSFTEFAGDIGLPRDAWMFV